MPPQRDRSIRQRGRLRYAAMQAAAAHATISSASKAPGRRICAFDGRLIRELSFGPDRADWSVPKAAMCITYDPQYHSSCISRIPLPLQSDAFPPLTFVDEGARRRRLKTIMPRAELLTRRASTKSGSTVEAHSGQLSGEPRRKAVSLTSYAQCAYYCSRLKHSRCARRLGPSLCRICRVRSKSDRQTVRSKRSGRAGARPKRSIMSKRLSSSSKQGRHHLRERRRKKDAWRKPPWCGRSETRCARWRHTSTAPCETCSWPPARAMPRSACAASRYRSTAPPTSLVRPRPAVEAGRRRRTGDSYAAVAAVFICKTMPNALSPLEEIAKRHRLTASEVRVFDAVLKTIASRRSPACSACHRLPSRRMCTMSSARPERIDRANW